MDIFSINHIMEIEGGHGMFTFHLAMKRIIVLAGMTSDLFLQKKPSAEISLKR